MHLEWAKMHQIHFLQLKRLGRPLFLLKVFPQLLKSYSVYVGQGQTALTFFWRIPFSSLSEAAVSGRCAISFPLSRLGKHLSLSLRMSFLFCIIRGLLLSACPSEAHRCVTCSHTSLFGRYICFQIFISRIVLEFNVESDDLAQFNSDTWLRNQNAFYITKGPAINIQFSLEWRITFFMNKSKGIFSSINDIWRPDEYYIERTKIFSHITFADCTHIVKLVYLSI